MIRAARYARSLPRRLAMRVMWKTVGQGGTQLNPEPCSPSLCHVNGPREEDQITVAREWLHGCSVLLQGGNEATCNRATPQSEMKRFLPGSAVNHADNPHPNMAKIAIDWYFSTLPSRLSTTRPVLTASPVLKLVYTLRSGLPLRLAGFAGGRR